jgi:hypothetical protein
MQTSSWQAVKPPPKQHVLRKYQRHLLSVPVQLYEISESDAVLAHGLTLDLSQGGVSAVLCGSVRVGATFRLELQLPNGTFGTRAIVRHARPGRCGFEFLYPSTDFDGGIAKCIERLAQ